MNSGLAQVFMFLAAALDYCNTGKCFFGQILGGGIYEDENNSFSALPRSVTGHSTKLKKECG
jgi:hypothetical protein